MSNQRVRLGLAVVFGTLLAAMHCGAQCIFSVTNAAGTVPILNQFRVQSYDGYQRCLDYTPGAVGSAVFINYCSLANPIGVEELADGKHTVILHAGNLVIGAKIPIGFTNAPPPPSCGDVACPKPTTPGLGTAEYPLVLQNPVTQQGSAIGQALLANQRFALDGDSIILSASMPAPPQPPTSSPVLVAKVENASGAVTTPVVLGPRNLADNEFWDFQSTNGCDLDPTTGFKHVSNADELYNALTNPTPGWGTVIKLDPIIGAYDLSLFNLPISVPAGVTIRGDRRGTHLGPQVLSGTCSVSPSSCTSAAFAAGADHLFGVGADYVRFTGLHLVGPSSSTSKGPGIKGIVVSLHDDGTQTFWTVVDHNDLSAWPDEAVGINFGLSETDVCLNVDPKAPPNLYVARNFIHHNERDDDGYGVLADGKTIIAGNTFLMNRHAIAASGGVNSEYAAWFNLVLSNVPSYCDSLGIFCHVNQDFDIHGSPSYGGLAGSELDIGWNTFLGGNRSNFDLRGHPCARNYFHDNVSERPFDPGSDSGGGSSTTDNHDAVWSYYSNVIQIFPNSFGSGFAAPYVPFAPQLWVFGNQFGNGFDGAPPYTDPTVKFGVGDFDGDSIDDLFLATGTAWYFSPGGKTEWRFLSHKSEKIDQLLFGDFGGDGRTDVVGINPNGQLVVSWGGVSDWEVLNSNPLPCSSAADMAVGDFDGDGKPDIFCADGTTWWISYGGNTPFLQVIVEDFTRVKDLRFGDFNGDGTTDVFGVVNGRFASPHWQVRYAPKGFQGFLGGWQPLPVSLTSNPASVDGLVVADFDGNGIADVGMSCNSGVSPGWRISYWGAQAWSACNTFSLSYSLVNGGVGRFSGGIGDDILVWGANSIFDIPAGTGTAYQLSAQDVEMR